MIKVYVHVSIDGEQPNVMLPKTNFKQNIFANDTRVIANFQKLIPG